MIRTEIFATFGPACGEEHILKEMIQAGMTGMRLNLSHTTLPGSRTYIEAYQKAAEETGVTPRILIDMQGPELRVGALEGVVQLEEGDVVCLFHPQKHGSNCCDEDNCVSRELSVSEEDNCVLRELSVSEKNNCVSKELTTPEENIHGTKEIEIPVPDPVIQAAEPDDEILLDDGKILLKILAENSFEENKKTFSKKESVKSVNMHFLDKPCLHAQVLRGGTLHSRKSVKIVNKNVKMPPLTAHDIENLRLAEDYGVTALMQPFVLAGEDLRYVRNILKEYGIEQVQIFAKIENRHGIEQIEDILPEADVLVIARGDLGNDMPLWELPRVQKQIEAACRKAGKPYIVVTQMLASMEEKPVPTRAEVSDIFHAVYHGAWGVMLTGETAIGKYPAEAVRYLANTAQEAVSYFEDIK